MASTKDPTEEQEFAPHNEHTRIDDQGDTVLVIKNYRIKVSSTMLALASPVFKAMLGPHFREGSEVRSAANPLEIPLPDDHPYGVLCMCYMIYHQVEHFLDDEICPDTTTLLHLMKAIDKYQCLASLKSQVRWLVSTELEPPFEEWWVAVPVTAMTYLTNDTFNFRIATNNLIINSDESFSECSEYDGGDIIPLNALLAMTEIRQSAKARLSDYFSTMAKGETEMTSSEGDALGRWPELEGETLDYITQELKGYGRDTSMKKLAKEVEEMCRGLCLKVQERPRSVGTMRIPIALQTVRVQRPRKHGEKTRSG